MPWLSPPVPTMSMAFGGASAGVMRARRNLAAPEISATGFAAHAQAHQERAHLHGRRDARHQEIERVFHFC